MSYMSDTKFFKLAHETARRLAIAAIQLAPTGWMVRVSPPTRSLEQNNYFWAVMDEIAAQAGPHGGRERTADEWATILVGTWRKAEWVPGVDPATGREDREVSIALGARTSILTVPEMSDVIELAKAFGANRGVVFSEDVRRAEAQLAASRRGPARPRKDRPSAASA